MRWSFIGPIGTLLFLSILPTWLPPTSVEAQNVKIVAKPDIVYIERSESGQHLNFDFLLENQTSDRLILSGVTVSVFDKRDKLTRREFVDEYSRASLELLPLKQGEIFAQMGASGDSLFPHLHYELRTGVGVKEVEGLPSRFTNFRRLPGSGPIVVKKGQVDTGDILESLEP